MKPYQFFSNWLVHKQRIILAKSAGRSDGFWIEGNTYVFPKFKNKNRLDHEAKMIRN